jgi:hypothetical protein
MSRGSAEMNGDSNRGPVGRCILLITVTDCTATIEAVEDVSRPCYMPTNMTAAAEAGGHSAARLRGRRRV